MASSRITGTNENISTYGDGTRNYTALSTWEAATDNDLVTAAQSEVLECYEDAASYDDAATITGATTSALYRRIIRPATGHRHDGTPNSGGIFFDRGAGATVIITGTEEYFVLDGLILRMTINDASTRNCVSLTGANCVVTNCIAYGSTNAGGGTVGGFHVIGNNSVIVNSVASTNTGAGFSNSGTNTLYVYNCSAYLNARGFYNSSTGTFIAKNCLASGNTTAQFANPSGTVTGSQNNSSSGTDVFGATNVYTSQTFTFVDTATHDLHLHRNDLGAKFRGTDLSADATFPFDDDIDGTTLTYWSIGMHSSQTLQSARRTGDNENVSTYAASGADYTSLSTWEAATDNDLVTAEVSEVLECAAGAYTDSIAMAGATTDRRYFRIIRPEEGAEHGGDPSSGVRFAATSGTITISIAELNASLQDIQATISGNTASNLFAILFATNGGGSCVGCIGHSAANAGAGAARGISVSGPTARVYLVDCLAYGNKSEGFFINSTNTNYFYNCTSVGNGTDGFDRTGGTVVAKNCLASDNTTDFSGTMTASYNASSDATASGTGSRTSQTFTFADSGSDDYHIAFADEGAKEFGTDLSADADFAFNDDIDAVAITTWSIGFDSDPSAPASGGGGGVLLIRRRRR